MIVEDSMRTSMSTIEPVNTRTLNIATIFAGLALAIAPLRGSAGVRGGLLILAAALIFWCYRHTGGVRVFVSRFRFLNMATLFWVTSVAAWACFSPTPIESLKSWRGDVLTPVLTGGVFYALTKEIRTLNRWLIVLLVGLAMLTWLVLASGDRAGELGYVPWYVDVGFLSTWLITLFPLAVLAAQLAFQDVEEIKSPALAKVLIAAAFAMLIVATSATNNRVAWVCHLLVIAVHFIYALSNRRALSAKLIVGYVFAILLMIGFFFASIELRATLSSQGTQGGVAFLANDIRGALWQRAWEMIQAQPLTGYGYAVEEFGQRFSAPFQHLSAYPLLRHAHNMLLNYGLQMGITGVISLVALFAALLLAFASLTRSAGLSRMLGVCGLSLVVTVFARNMVDDFFMRHTVLLFAATCGMLLGLGQRSETQPDTQLRAR